MKNPSENQAKEKLKKISNLLVLFNITKNKKLALLALEEIEKAIKIIINSILRYEHSLKRFKLSKNPEINFRNFENISQSNYNLQKEDIIRIKEILKVSKAHKKSTMEFTRNHEIVILSENQTFQKISPKKLYQSLTTLEKLLKNLNLKLSA